MIYLYQQQEAALGANKPEIPDAEKGTDIMTINYNGTEITLTQDPYIVGIANERPVYKAHAADLNGNEYFVEWDVVDEWESIEDESDMCDWDSPKVKPL